MRELALHILDIVENSIEASALEVRLEIIEDFKQDLLVIKVLDNGCDMDEKIVNRVRDPFVTTRVIRHVGLGIPLIDMNTSPQNRRIS